MTRALLPLALAVLLPAFARSTPSYVEAVRALPRGAARAELVAGLRRDLDPVHGRGWALLDTRPWVSPRALRELAAGLPERGKLELRAPPRRPLSAAPLELRADVPRDRVRALLRYLAWTHGALDEALAPRERLAADVADVRLMTRRDAGESTLHPDGGYLALSLALDGRGTLYQPAGPGRKPTAEAVELFHARADDGPSLEPAPGVALIFSALSREHAHEAVSALWHASPAHEDRKVVIARYELRQPGRQVPRPRRRGYTP